MNYLSHPDKKLTDHIAQIAAAYDDMLFQTAVHYHDAGKTTDSFQHYISSSEVLSSEPHAPVSGLIFLLGEHGLSDCKALFFIYNAIISHHGSLHSRKSICDNLANLGEVKMQLYLKQLAHIYAKEDARDFFAFQENGAETRLDDIGFEFEELSFSPQNYITQKQLYSRLIYADKYEAIFSQTPIRKPSQLHLEQLEDYKRQNLKPDALRQNARDTIINHFKANPHAPIYTITAPTGIGKTLISLELALKIAKAQQRDKIIYSIPFTSIIDQSAKIFDTIFPDQITVHHHKADYTSKDEEADNKEYDRIKFLVESWSEPFIVTTFYQLFFALFSNANSDNVKFQSFENSVVILDEVQAIPFPLWKVMQTLFPLLSEQLHVTFVLMSATLPIVAKDTVELSDTKTFYAQKNRYRLEYFALAEEEEKLQRLCDAIVERYKRGESVLCVLNTIKNTKKLFALVKAAIGDDAYCLNSYMLPCDRIATIEALKEAKSNRVAKKVLISTQVIEAGVDLDFDVGFRELSPLSSIIQTAGRVNREGLREQAQLFVFDALDIKITRLIYNGILMTPTENILLKHLKEVPLQECEIFDFVQEYFVMLDISISDREKVLEAIKHFDFWAINTAIKKIFNTDNDYIVSVLIGIDMKTIEQEYFEETKNSDDKWRDKSLREQKFKSLSDYIVNIKQKDLLQSGINSNKSELFGLHYITESEGVYSSRSGFLIEGEDDENSIFG